MILIRGKGESVNNIGDHQLTTPRSPCSPVACADIESGRMWRVMNSASLPIVCLQCHMGPLISTFVLNDTNREAIETQLIFQDIRRPIYIPVPRKSIEFNPHFHKVWRT